MDSHDDPPPDLATFLAGNAAWAEDHHDPRVAKVPGRGLAIVTCMDARLDPLRSLGLGPGDAHVLRNAGALVTDDVERSLVLSQYALRTSTILVIGHTDCGVQDHDEEATADQVERERGQRPAMALGSFPSPLVGVRAGVERLRTSPLLQEVDDVRGFVFDVSTGLLDPID